MGKNITDNKLQYQSFFWSPDYLENSSAWIEHIPFAFWIIEILKPKILVELGVHSGTSYFSFCQAVKRLNIDTLCYGVDSWKGDEHAGFYTEEVFEKVDNHNMREFSRFSTLVKSTFDEAKEYFIDRSIDLLHIDGLHTYEAVKHDFEAWLPKLSDRSILIFHDINVREKNFGVFRLWEELKQKYSYFQFDFGHGLGILSVGKIIHEELKELFNENRDETYYAFLKNLFSERGNFFKVISNNDLQLKEQSNKIKALTEVNATLELHNAQLFENSKALELHNAELREHDRGSVLHNAQLTERSKELELLNEQLNEDHKTLELNNSQLRASFSALELEHRQLKVDYKKLELTNNELQKKYEADRADFSEKIRDAGSSLKNALNELSTAKKENELLKTHVTWYRDTYENRGLLGVLKEKIKGNLKKKVNHNVDAEDRPFTCLDTDRNSEQGRGMLRSQKLGNRANSYDLHPANDIKLSDDGTYTAIGTDPFFLIDFKNKQIKKGWYWLRIEVTENEGMLQKPTLYCDYGRGFNEQDVWRLPNLDKGKIESLVQFPVEIKQLRFDPTTTGCDFTIKQFFLRPVSTIKAFQIATSIHRKDQRFYGTSFFALVELTRTLFKSGISGVNKKINDSIGLDQEQKHIYATWCALYDSISDEQFNIIKSLSEGLPYQPIFSIIMPVYNPSIKYLKKAIESVEGQAYQNWQLCIADDKSTNGDVRKLLSKYQSKDQRIKIIFRETNGHISNASNSALQLATGEYIVLLDQDDELTPHCLYMAARAINENRELELIYSDEDKIDEEGNRFDPYFKTDWNKDLFYGQNMISHLGVYKLSLVKKINGFRPGYEGSQDYDLALRCIEHLRPSQIHHIPHVLYHWRAVKGSTSVSVSNKNYAMTAGIKALKDHLKRTGQKATVEQNINNSYRVKWSLPDQKPMVSIIIPTKDNVKVLSSCVTSIFQKTDYRNFEIVIIDNNSSDSLTLEYLQTIRKHREQVQIYCYKSEFNFSAMINYGVKQSQGEVVVLLNNDTEVITEDWLYEMVSQSMREEIGAVGAKLYYPDGEIQHAGVYLYEGHPGNHIYHRKDRDDPGYFNKLNLVQNYSAVTAACLAIRKELFIKVEGFDEKNLKIAYNDVDFCLKIRESGYRNLWTPYARLVHHESLSRGNDLDEINFLRFKGERSYMLTKWKDAVSNDPFFNPNLGHDTRTGQLAFPPRVKYGWQDK